MPFTGVSYVQSLWLSDSPCSLGPFAQTVHGIHVRRPRIQAFRFPTVYLDTRELNFTNEKRSVESRDGQGYSDGGKGSVVHKRSHSRVVEQA